MPRIEASTVAEHHALRRSAILAAAVDILGSQGPGALTPAAVAAVAGLARSSVYQYFPSTAALVAAGVEETFRLAIERIDAAMAAAASAPEQVAAYVDGALAAAAAGHQPMSLYAAGGLPDECREAMRELHRRTSEPLVAALTAYGIPDAATVGELIGGVVSAGAAQVTRGEPLAAVQVRVRHFVLGWLTCQGRRPPAEDHPTNPGAHHPSVPGPPLNGPLTREVIHPP